LSLAKWRDDAKCNIGPVCNGWLKQYWLAEEEVRECAGGDEEDDVVNVGSAWWLFPSSAEHA